jgi:hypothetical protein
MAPSMRQALRAAVWQAGKHPTIKQYDRLQATLSRAVAAAPPPRPDPPSRQGAWQLSTDQIRWESFVIPLSAVPGVGIGGAQAIASGRVPRDIWKAWPIGQWVRVSRRQKDVLAKANPDVAEQGDASTPGVFMICFLSVPTSR